MITCRKFLFLTSHSNAYACQKTLEGPLTPYSFILFSISLFAQDRTVTGKITDSKSGNPIEGASVVPKGTN